MRICISLLIYYLVNPGGFMLPPPGEPNPGGLVPPGGPKDGGLLFAGGLNTGRVGRGGLMPAGGHGLGGLMGLYMGIGASHCQGTLLVLVSQ